MAQTQTTKSYTQKLRNWGRRHKILTVFCTLLVAGILYFGVSAIVWNLQIHFERQRFYAVAEDMKVLQGKFVNLQSKDLVVQKSCQHSNSGAIFAIEHIYCGVDINGTFTNLGEQENLKLIQKTRQLMANFGMKIGPSVAPVNEEQIARNDFQYDGLPCVFGAWYYTQETPLYDRYSNFSKTGTLTEINITCGKTSKKDYFPRNEY